MDRGAVLSRFTVTSAFMWALPLMVLAIFSQRWFIDFVGVAPEQATLWSGLTAVLSVNVVVGIYIYMALQDAPTAAQPQPDPAFLAAAQRSLEPTAGDFEARQRQAAAAGSPATATATATAAAAAAASTLTQRRGAGAKQS